MDELRALGEALGGPEWVQGPGGNVSVKVGDVLAVKASGKRLRDLGQPGSHAEVPLALARAALAGDAEADRETFARTPRPSLETYFHALGGRVVAHTHSIGAMLVACSRAPRPEGLLSVPYERPGRMLGVRVAEALAGARTGAVLMESHGLVVYADSVEEAVSRSRELDRTFRESIDVPLSSFAERVSAPYEVVPVDANGAVMTTLPPRTPSTGPARYLTPDAVVYASVSRVVGLDDAKPLAREALAAFGRPVVLVADDGRRVQCARNADELAQAREVALAHDYVEDALRARGDAIYLPDDEPARVVGMPSEQYRLALTRKES
jgi:ribulose-5-phosphate 4-epimerase/fuculose-1-phosphate aldolase